MRHNVMRNRNKWSRSLAAMAAAAAVAVSGARGADRAAWNLFADAPPSEQAAIDFNPFHAPVELLHAPAEARLADGLTADFNVFVAPLGARAAAAASRTSPLTSRADPLVTFARSYAGTRYHATDGRTTRGQLIEHYGFSADVLAALSEHDCTAILGGLMTGALPTDCHPSIQRAASPAARR